MACEAFFARYFDERGFLECVERWSGDDEPDDAIENLSDWPILRLDEKAGEGRLRQYNLARTRDVEFARDGMDYKEFPVMFDWMHNGEGLTVFNLQGLSDPVALRAGLPENVAALVESISADEVKLVLVNVSQIESRAVVVQAGGCAEHQFISVAMEGREFPIDRPEIKVHLAPGAGARLLIRIRRYVNPPTLSPPWERN